VADLGKLFQDQPQGQITTSVASAAKALEVSKETIRKAIREGKLKSFLLGRRRLIYIVDLHTWIQGK
jgi:excisionase family DNA binding protein